MYLGIKSLGLLGLIDVYAWEALVASMRCVSRLAPVTGAQTEGIGQGMGWGALHTSVPV